MESITIKFTANGQQLTGGGLHCASNTVHYIIADFDLGDNWQGYDSVRAVWSNDFKCISTVLDPSGSCTVPHEVLERRGKVSVNLVGSILEDDELTDRLTTYPIVAITVDANAKICGTETAEVTPSQFEQYVAIVIAEVEKVTGMTAVAYALPEGSAPTANYSGGVLTLGIPKGDTGATGNGISSVEFNEDYSLTFYFTDSEPFTTPSIRGAQGARGYGIASVEKIDSTGLVDTYKITFEDPSVQPTTFTVTNGEEGPQGPRGYTGETGNGIESVYLTETHGAVKTYTILFTDGNTTTFDVTDGEVTNAQLTAAVTDLKEDFGHVSSDLQEFATDGEYKILNPLNMFESPDFSDRSKWGAQNGTLAYTSRSDSLSEVCTLTRVDTSAGGYLIATLPVNKFVNGKTYRISIRLVSEYDSSQKIAIRQNTDGVIGHTMGWIVTDDSMTEEYHRENDTLFYYEWTVNSADFSTYPYIQIQFKITNAPRSYVEPFIGLSTGDTNYTVDVVANWALKADTIYPVNLFGAGFNSDYLYNAGTGEKVSSSGYVCSKPQLFKAGDYLFVINKQFFGSSASKYFVFSSVSDVNATSIETATLSGEFTRKTGSDTITYGIYALTISTDKILAFNVGKTTYDDDDYFMVVDGSSLADYPASYLAYFTPYSGVTEGVKMNQTMLSQTNPLYGKKIVLDGDSICIGYGASGGYGKMIASTNNMIYENYGESGGTITYGTKNGANDRHWVSNAVDSYSNDADYYILEGGVNDVANSVTLGSISTSYDSANFDRTTFIGALEYICAKLETLYVGKKVGFVFVHGIFNDTNYFPDWHEDYKPAMLKVFEKWGIPYIDLESLVPPLNQIASLKSVYTNAGDGWHPNKAGYETFYVPKIEAWLKTL